MMRARLLWKETWMRRLLPGLFLAILLGLPSIAGATDAPTNGPVSAEIVDVSVARKDGQYQVSFRLRGGLDAETLDRIAAGLETVLEYRVEVLRRRRLWPDERVAQYRLLAIVKYESLSRQYGLTLKMNGDVVQSSTTHKPEEMKRWITEIRGVPLGPIGDFVPPEEYTVRVRSDFPPRFVFFFIPWSQDTPWVRVPLSPMAPDDHERGR